jgi:hypothetical protein
VVDSLFSEVELKSLLAGEGDQSKAGSRVLEEVRYTTSFVLA